MMTSPRQMTNLVQVLLVIPLIMSCLTVAKGQPQPAIGDIQLEKSAVPDFYEVLVYYGDGIQPPEWGGICADISVQTAGVICKQLGYKPHESPTTYRDTGRPVWLQNVECSSNIYSHILRCGHTVLAEDERNSSMSCGYRRERLLLRCDFSTRLDPYDGEIRLCPPDGTHNDPDIMSSISYGLVALRFHSEWRGVTQISEDTKALLGGTEADAICRQLGYTDAVIGSAVARSATGYSFESCFQPNNGQGFYMNLNAWMPTESVSCNNRQNCLRCCYNDPPDTGCDKNKCDRQRDIVIGCTIDPSKLKSLEPQQRCDLTQSNLRCSGEVCSSEKKTIKKLSGGLGTVLALSVLLNVIVLIESCRGFKCTKAINRFLRRQLAMGQLCNCCRHRIGGYDQPAEEGGGGNDNAEN